jgi:hypothetical protein
MAKSKEFPWWKSEDAIIRFFSKERNFFFELPDDLPAKELVSLYDKMKTLHPAALMIWSQILDHPNCPKSLLIRAYDDVTALNGGIQGCLHSLSLRESLGPERLLPFIKGSLDTEAANHAVGTLVGIWEKTRDPKLFKELEEVQRGNPIMLISEALIFLRDRLYFRRNDKTQPVLPVSRRMAKKTKANGEN